MIVNGPLVDQRSLRIDDVHVRRRLGGVQVAYGTVRIQQYGSRRSVYPFYVVVLFVGRNVALGAGR